MADNKKTVQIEFKTSGQQRLVQELNAVAKSSEKLIANHKKAVVAQDRRNKEVKKLRASLKSLGVTFAGAGISSKTYTQAIHGSRIALNRLKIQTQKHIASLKHVSVQTAKTTNRTRILGGTFAVLRSKLLLFNFMMGLGIRQLVKFGESASKVESMEKAFNTLSGGVEISSDSLEKLENATNNTMSQFDLFQQANNAMILGVSKNSDEMAEMFDIAQRLGRALGRDTASSVESLITGIGRQSRLMLDNIGIIVKADEAYDSYAKKLGTTADNLSDAEKKQAFLEATMESARAKIATLGKEVTTSQDAYDKFTASTANLSTEIGNTLQPKVSFLAKTFSTLTDNIAESLKISRLAREEYNMDASLQERREIVIGRITKAEKLLAKQRANDSGDVITYAKAENFIANQRNLLHNLNKLISKQQERNIVLNKEEAKALKEKTEVDVKAKKTEKERLRIKKETNKAIKDGLFHLSDEEKAMFSMSLTLERMTKFGARADIGISVEKVDQLTEGFKATNVSLDFLDEKQKFAVQGMNAFGDALAQATIHGQNFGDAVVNSLKSIATQLVARAGTYALLNMFAGGGFSKTTSFLKFAGFAHTGGYIKEDKTIQRFATGGQVQGEDNVPIMAQAGEFVMSRNAVDSIGIDNLARMNQTGNAGVTINIQGNMVGNEEFVREMLIPEINKTVNQGLA